VNAIYLSNTGEPFVCIHCGRCISFCPHNCLEMTESPKETLSKDSEEVRS
jgi:formate hydrogenlyase subunit 6/NADH:ubiquinone oxidoreductase subunit I